jgi:hypothetical protein
VRTPTRSLDRCLSDFEAAVAREELREMRDARYRANVSTAVSALCRFAWVSVALSLASGWPVGGLDPETLRQLLIGP